MLQSLTLLLVLQLVGESVVLLFKWPVPGPVVGMALLFFILVLRGGGGEPLRDTANTLLSHLSLLFVPAGVGVMLHIGRLREEWLPLTVALVVSTTITIVVSASVLGRFHRPPKAPAEVPQ